MSDKPPARWLHNEKLAKEWLEARKLSYTVQSVSKQVPTLPLNRRALSMFGYNPSIIRHQGRLLMAYRWHTQANLSTSLAMAELDNSGNVILDRQIDLPGTSTEDPKLFIYRDELYMSWVESTWPKMPPQCCVKYGKLVEGKPWTVPQPFQVQYGKNDGKHLEKNFVFFPQGEKLFCIYSCNPHVVLEVKENKAVAEYVSPGARWSWGAIKGGTAPVDYGEHLLRFAHSTLDNEPLPYRRRYYLLALLLEKQPPFKVVRVSDKPVVRGSETDELPDIERRSILQYKPQVIFPGGCIHEGNAWWVACGVNDSQCVVLKLEPKHLNLP